MGSSRSSLYPLRTASSADPPAQTKHESHLLGVNLGSVGVQAEPFISTGIDARSRWIDRTHRRRGNSHRVGLATRHQSRAAVAAAWARASHASPYCTCPDQKLSRMRSESTTQTFRPARSLVAVT